MQYSITLANTFKLRKMTRLLPLMFLLVFGIKGQAQNHDSTRLGQLIVVTEEGIDELRSRYMEKKKTSNEFPGYRVQIYNGRKAQLLKKKTDFLGTFPNVQTYTLYDAPEYKLQVGDFRTRLEAEKFLREVVSSYGSGFVVRTMIKRPSLE